MQLGDFAGLWWFDRVVLDPAGQQTARVVGTVTFTPDAAGLVADEAGEMRLAHAAPLKAERRTLWRARDDRLALFFGDGRPFLEFDPAARPCRARHDCAPDLYRVAYDFDDWPLWRASWRVTGPRKDYLMVTLHARDPDTLARHPVSGQVSGNELEDWEWLTT